MCPSHPTQRSQASLPCKAFTPRGRPSLVESGTACASAATAATAAKAGTASFQAARVIPVTFSRRRAGQVVVQGARMRAMRCVAGSVPTACPRVAYVDFGRKCYG